VVVVAQDQHDEHDEQHGDEDADAVVVEET
jgi:hypothetical protein